MVDGLAKLTKELLRGMLKPVTVNYPAERLPDEFTLSLEEIRGKHRFDEDKCVGCGACNVVCSSGAITVSDSQDQRVLKVEVARCIFCGRCRDICPEKGLELTSEFELSQTGSRGGDCVKVEQKISMRRCEGCGRPTFPTKQIDSVKTRVLDKIDPSSKETASRDLEVYVKYCLDCRRTRSYAFNIHPRKSY